MARIQHGVLYFVFLLSRLFSLCFCYYSPSTANISHIEEYNKKQAAILKKILTGYDKRFIPTIPGHPLKVEVEVVIADIFKLDESAMELHTLLYIRQRWYDYRLSWNSTDIQRIKVREHLLEEIWIPDIRMRNMKAMSRFEDFGGINMNIYSTGKIYFSQLALVTVDCPMDLHNFPVDRQTCSLNFLSYAYGRSLLLFSLVEEKTIVRAVHLPQFHLIGTSKLVHKDNMEVVVPKVSVTVTFQRRAGYYIIQIYVPSAFLVMLSWLSFFMDSSDIANRLALEVTMILSIVFLLTNSNSSLPHLSYAKASDIFIITSFAFIFMALLQTMLSYQLSKKKGLGCNRLKRLANMENYSMISGLRCVKRREAKCIGDGEDTKHDGENSRCMEQSNNVMIEPTVVAETKSEHQRFWLDTLCIFLFPSFYAIFNAVYWHYYL